MDESSKNISARLDYLIDYLLNERGSEPATSQPHNDQQRFDMFRALVNVREPKPIGDEFLRVQDEMLQSVTAAKGIFESDELPDVPGHPHIALWQGDITALRVDAIVNAANSGMLGCFVPGHHCIDNAIHTYAGVQLRLACAEIMQQTGHPEPTGQARITSGFNLPAAHVIHTVGPIVIGALTQQQSRQLADCYTACLDAARLTGCRSIAFCCISTGVFGFPQREAARIAVDAVEEYLLECEGGMHVVFDVFLDEDLQIYRQLLGI